VDILAEARLPVDCVVFVLGEVCASDDMLKGMRSDVGGLGGV
jgi:hypothetical protein